MSRRRRQRNPVAIGALVFAVLIAISYAGFHKRVPFTHRSEISAIFRSASSLRKGSPVRIAGVDVGQVTGIGRGPGTTARIRMTISSRGLPLHRDARLKIRPRVFLEGGFYVELDPGSPSAPTLHDGDELPAAQTADPVLFAQVLSAFDRPTRTSLRGVVAELARALAGGGAQGLRMAIVSLAPALRDGAIVARAAQGTDPGDLSQLVRSGAVVSRALGSREAQLADLVDAYARTAAALACCDGALGQSAAQLERTLRAAPAALDALDGALPVLGRSAVALRPGLRAAAPALQSADRALAALALLAQPSRLGRFVGLLHPVLVALPELERRLGVLLPKVTPVMSCLGGPVLDTLNARLDDGALSTGRPVWQDLTHSAVGLASAAQNFDANGPWVRYLVQGGSQSVLTNNTGGLVGTASQPLLGSRPVWNGPGAPPPPLRPDQPCTAQPRTDLAAGAGAPSENGGALARAGSAPSLRRLGRAALRGRRR